MNDIIEWLTQCVADAEREGEDMNSASWAYQEGVLITYNQAKKLIEILSNKDNQDIEDILP